MSCSEPVQQMQAASFKDLLPRVESVHFAVRRVISRSGCELASALLVCELRDAGFRATFVRGHYLAPNTDRNPLHAWVEIDDLLLDATRDQYLGEPFTESYPGTYVRDGGRPPADLKQLIYDQLQRQFPFKREEVLALITTYQLDPQRLEDDAARSHWP